MKEEFTLTLGDRTYLLKRMDHPEMRAAYRVEFTHRDIPLTFCMTRKDGQWTRLPQSLPYYVNMDGGLLSEAIAQNEAEG